MSAASETDYTPLFDPALEQQPDPAGRFLRRGDEIPERGYVYDPEGRIATAVNVALATGRPLLVRGKPGTGKSSLAQDVARRFGWCFHRATITSRTRPRDLLWTFDAVRRLNDATAEGGAGEPVAYVTPGVLWWAFSPKSAATRGLPEDSLDEHGVTMLANPSGGSQEGAVVLLDEIDKADPDLPNDLLVPLGSLEFVFSEVEPPVRIRASKAPLVVVTTNEERDLPQAFLRRCVVLVLEEPGHDRMLALARAHFDGVVSESVMEEVLTRFEKLRADQAAEEHEPGPAEFLDAVAAVAALRAKPDGGERWDQLAEFAWRKPAPE